MIAIPAIDLRDGACVQLTGGRYEDERIRIDDPLSALERWEACGFTQLHVVDLDAASGCGDNRGGLVGLVERWTGDVQVGGGLRTTDRVAEMFDAGAARAVVGTRALEDHDWLVSIARAWPERVIVAVDVRDRAVVAGGWRRIMPGGVLETIDRLGQLPLAGVLVTAVHVEGRLAGPDLELTSSVATRTRLPVIASGGVAAMEDLRALASAGASAAVVGMALYAGTIDACTVAREFAR